MPGALERFAWAIAGPASIATHAARACQGGFEEALHHVNRKSCEHTITTQYGAEILSLIHICYPDAKGLYLALRTGGGVFGVIGIDLSEKPLDAFENSVLLY